MHKKITLGLKTPATLTSLIRKIKAPGEDLQSEPGRGEPAAEMVQDPGDSAAPGDRASPQSTEQDKERLRFQFLEQKYGYYHCKDCKIRWESAYVWCGQGTSKFCSVCENPTALSKWRLSPVKAVRELDVPAQTDFAMWTLNAPTVKTCVADARTNACPTTPPCFKYII